VVNFQTLLYESSVVSFTDVLLN